MIIKNETLYQVLKWLAIVALPAIATATSCIMGACGVNADVIAMVVTIITALATLLGTLLGVSTYNYNGLVWEDDEEEAEG